MEGNSQIHVLRNRTGKAASAPAWLSPEATEPVRRLHRSVDAYRETPLLRLHNLAEHLGVRDIYVKDESERFGLKAFKGLGGIYALTRAVCRHLGLDEREILFPDLKLPEYRDRIRQIVFVTATDGNHGKGVAWAAAQLGCRAYVYMPKGSSEYRAQAIRDVGKAVVTITDMGYDDTVRYAKRMSEEQGWVLIQDTSWPGYEEVPSWIIQGYTTMAWEAAQQLSAREAVPTHVFLQAGVGAMAGGVLGFLANVYQEKRPAFCIVEAKEAACIYESVECGDGKAHAASGNAVTIMAGLNCSEPCTLTWPILRDLASACISCPDSAAEEAMRRYARPYGDDPRIVAGESGAASMGALLGLLEDPNLAAEREKLGLNGESVILLFNTEGDTDPESYCRIIEEKKEGGAI